jgi:threonine/homoserine/homoserine lactone efflux protein
VSIGQPDATLEMIRHGGVFMLITLVVFLGYGRLAALIRSTVAARPGARCWLDRLFAASFIALASKLALSDA